MVPVWTTPIALGMGNPAIRKPSEKDPMTMNFIAGLMKQAGIPDGVYQLLNGTKPTVHALLEHEDVKAVIFVETSHVAEVIQKKSNATEQACSLLGWRKGSPLRAPRRQLRHVHF